MGEVMRGIGYFGCLVTAGVLSTVGNIAAAQAPAAEPEQFIVTGTRETAQTQFTALSPVDVFSKDTITSVSTDHLDEVLATIVPYYDVKRLPASDGPEFIKPASLDGLSPDMTLVLLNGKRFHRSAFIEGSGQSAGSQSADLAQIPTFAIGHVEVLRDGASAQYGSDAIAGVINILLDTKPGFEAYGEGSQFYAGDGGTGSAGARAGFALGDGGHLVVTTQLERGEPTSRTTQRPDAIALQAANPSLTVPNPVQRWGNPAEETFKSAVSPRHTLSAPSAPATAWPTSIGAIPPPIPPSSAMRRRRRSSPAIRSIRSIPPASPRMKASITWTARA